MYQEKYLKNYRVLITAIGGFLGVKNIENLKKAKPGEIYVVGVDANETCMGSKVCDKFFKVSTGEKKEYVSEIINIIEKEKINFILPCSDEEAISLAQQKNRINNMGAELLCVDESSIEVISDKLKTYEFLKSKKIEVPFFNEVNDYEDLKIKAMQYYKKFSSFVLKETKARGNRGIYVVDVKNEKESYFNSSRELHTNIEIFQKKIFNRELGKFPKLITEKLYEPAFDIDVLARKGKVIHAIPRERINPAGVPFKGNIIRKNEKLIDIAEKVTKELNLTYLFDIDIMTNKNGEFIICEINPRPSGSVAASIACGFPIYKDLLDLKNINKFSSNIFSKKDRKVFPVTDCLVI